MGKEYYEYHERRETLMERFPYQGFPDPQEAPIVANCECGAEIYEEGFDRCVECEELGDCRLMRRGIKNGFYVCYM